MVHESDDGEAGDAVGAPESLDPGEYDDPAVEPFDIPGVNFGNATLEGNQTLTAMPARHERHES